MDSTAVPTVYQTDRHAFFRRRHNSTWFFAVAILLFFLPFAEFKCGGMSLMHNTGLGIAVGQHWKISNAWAREQVTEKIGKSGMDQEKMLKEGINIFALAAIAAGLFGIGIAFSAAHWRSMAGMCAGILGILMLLALMVQYRVEMGSLLSKDRMGDDQLGFALGGILKLQFTIWYYLSMACFGAAAFLNYMRDKILLRDAMAAAVDFEFQRTASGKGAAPTDAYGQ